MDLTLPLCQKCEVGVLRSLTMAGMERRSSTKLGRALIRIAVSTSASIMAISVTVNLWCSLASDFMG